MRRGPRQNPGYETLLTTLSVHAVIFLPTQALDARIAYIEMARGREHFERCV